MNLQSAETVAAVGEAVLLVDQIAQHLSTHLFVSPKITSLAPPSPELDLVKNISLSMHKN